MSSKRRSAHHEEHMDESWLIPYADLLTLLLALFIVLFAMSNVDQAKFDAMSQGMAMGFGSSGSGVLPGNVGPNPNPGTTIPTPRPPTSPSPGASPSGSGNLEDDELADLQKIQADLAQYFEEEGMLATIGLGIDERGLVISLSDSVLFDSGSADIKPAYRDMLIKVGTIINRLDNYIRVEGHTDNVPMHNAKFDSNWELSSSRATNVLRLFIKESEVPPQKLYAVGYAEFRPVADNTTSEGRAKNRRVDIIILSRKFNALEMGGDNIG